VTNVVARKRALASSSTAASFRSSSNPENMEGPRKLARTIAPARVRKINPEMDPVEGMCALEAREGYITPALTTSHPLMPIASA